MVEEDEYCITDDVETNIQYGDLFKLGNHRLVCGDCLDSTVMEKLMQHNKADMCFTDPPYLMDFSGSVHSDGSKSYNSQYNRIVNDNLSKAEAQEFINNLVRVLKDNVSGAYYICFYRLGLDYILNALNNINSKYRAIVIWDKGNHTLSNSDYMSHYEPIVYGWFEEHNFYGGNNQVDIWNIPRTQRNDLHPTMKPLNLVSKAVGNSSEENDVVLDIFGGSGSTLIACEQLNRCCYMVEKEPVYCQIIINRWEEFTGGKAEKIN